MLFTILLFGVFALMQGEKIINLLNIPIFGIFVKEILNLKVKWRRILQSY